MTLEIIPVIDLQNGVVVHAKQGMRHLYKPLQSAISEQTDIETICKTFLTKFGLNQIYIADLNAISNTGDQSAIIRSLFQSIPEMYFWIDSGTEFIGLNETDYLRYRPIIGTETGFSLDDLDSYTNRYSNMILSLDFTSQGLLGSADILQHPKQWPETIILMNLDRVGTQSGVNIERIAMVQSKLSSSQKLYVAGGIRNATDMQTLENMDIDGVLIATALHTKSIQLDPVREQN